MTAITWRGWTLSTYDGDWLCARRRVDGVLHTVMVRPRKLGGYRAAVYRATWPTESRAVADAETAEAALDAAAKAAGMVLR
jgi:hypothetical protein